MPQNQMKKTSGNTCLNPIKNAILNFFFTDKLKNRSGALQLKNFKDSDAVAMVSMMTIRLTHITLLFINFLHT